MKSWKTTVAGSLTALGTYLANQDNQTLKVIGQILMVVGPFLLGAVAKDSNVTGGTKQQ